MFAAAAAAATATAAVATVAPTVPPATARPLQQYASAAVLPSKLVPAPAPPAKKCMAVADEWCNSKLFDRGVGA